MLELNKLYLGDCIDILKNIEDNSISSVVTDPPYGIRFMNKKWDYQIPSVEIWQEIFRVLKPGGHMLCFGGTKTYHRLVCNIEDAGFEIRDCIMWVYGSGMPKSMSISRAIDKYYGVDGEREVIGLKPNLHSSGDFKKHDGYKRPWMESSDANEKTMQLTSSVTEEAKWWDGWGTAIKPAYEPIVLARKPISEKTLVENVLKWGVGCLNVDECRVIPTGECLTGGADSKSTPRSEGWDRPWRKDTVVYSGFMERRKENIVKATQMGRFPANLIHDGSDEVLDLFEEFGDNKGQLAEVRGTEPSECHVNVYSKRERGGIYYPKKDELGSAARFFYCAKASPKERGKGNTHPTVKPIALLKYLIKLITPKGGVVLDPFIGSGSTALAAGESGYYWLGIDKDKETFDIAQRRIINYF